MPKTILITAAEPSGDRQGGALMAELNRRDPNLRWVGVGGPQMTAQRLTSAFPLADVAVMGLAEVVPAIPRILHRLKQLQTLAHHTKPDLIITIDGQDFSKRLAQRLKHLGVPHVHYVAPKVWAWRQGRVRQLKQLYTHLLCNLPFEAPWFAAAGLPTTYVGHPMVTQLATVPRPAHRALQLALLPGSRRSELTRHWPTFLATYRRLRQLIPALTGVVVLPSEAAATQCRTLAPWGDEEGLSMVTGEPRFAALAQATAALAKSGTNNLEMALLQLPAVVCYRMHPLSFWLAKRLVKVTHVSLPNLILNPPGQAGQGIVYPEFLQAAAKPENLARALYPLLTNAKAAARQQAKLAEVTKAMATSKPAAVLAADVVETYLAPLAKP
ncbi:MAG: lipid-A-disaccharide synthase [Alphaproteobacteria bacterium]|nr:lipid-A-disaccharide synthase [Alphaproteobacteria bacterium]